MQKSTAPRIFVVDNEAIIATTLAMVLRSQGLDATAFTEPDDALAEAESQSPALLVADVSMPQVSGVELAMRMLKTCPACKVLLFSGHGNNHDLLRDARAGGLPFEFLSKPAHPLALLTLVRKMLGLSVPDKTLPRGN
jgi:FixJ family two-component response regulator